jgi:sugar-specific transcriptional regulator TrmB
LGPNSIKNIAEKVKIPRPTVYEIVKKLKEKELFVETKKGKKFINPSKSA